MCEDRRARRRRVQVSGRQAHGRKHVAGSLGASSGTRAAAPSSLATFNETEHSVPWWQEPRLNLHGSPAVSPTSPARAEDSSSLTEGPTAQRWCGTRRVTSVS